VPARAGAFATAYPRDAARAIVTLCTALTQWCSPSGPRSPEQIAVHYVRFALDLVQAAARWARHVIGGGLTTPNPGNWQAAAASSRTVYSEEPHGHRS